MIFPDDLFFILMVFPEIATTKKYGETENVWEKTRNAISEWKLIEFSQQEYIIYYSKEYFDYVKCEWAITRDETVTSHSQ